MSRGRAARIVGRKVEINKLRKRERKEEGIYLVGEIFIGLALLVRARRHFLNSGSDRDCFICTFGLQAFLHLI